MARPKDGSKPLKRRQMGLAGWVRLHYPPESRIMWDDLWLSFCDLTAARSQCSRDRVGAVVVSADNRLLSMGYNGPPVGMPCDGPCVNWCQRAMNPSNLDPEYLDCPSLHAEANCLLRTTGLVPGASMYVNSGVCMRCALMIANSGVSRVVMRVNPKHRHRKPNEVVSLLMDCGIDVLVHSNINSRYRKKFVDAHGVGPHPCYFCTVVMPSLEVIHHIDGNHSNDELGNLAPAHAGCHGLYHRSAKGVNAPNRRITITPKWERRKPMLACVTCGAEMTPGWLAKHCELHGHDDGGAVAEWQSSQRNEKADPARRACRHCGQVFDRVRSRSAHEWRCANA